MAVDSTGTHRGSYGFVLLSCCRYNKASLSVWLSSSSSSRVQSPPKLVFLSSFRFSYIWKERIKGRNRVAKSFLANTSTPFPPLMDYIFTPPFLLSFPWSSPSPLSLLLHTHKIRLHFCVLNRCLSLSSISLLILKEVMPRTVIRPEGEKKVRLFKKPLRKLVSDPIEIGQEAREGVDYGKEKNEKGEVLEYPAHWKMKVILPRITFLIVYFINNKRNWLVMSLQLLMTSIISLSSSVLDWATFMNCEYRFLVFRNIEITGISHSNGSSKRSMTWRDIALTIWRITPIRRTRGSSSKSSSLVMERDKLANSVHNSRVWEEFSVLSLNFLLFQWGSQGTSSDVRRGSSLLQKTSIRGAQVRRKNRHQVLRRDIWYGWTPKQYAASYVPDCCNKPNFVDL